MRRPLGVAALVVSLLLGSASAVMAAPRAPHPLAASIRLTHAPGPAGLRTDFRFRAALPSHDHVLSYHLDFGDHHSAHGAHFPIAMAHIYSAGGRYKAQLSVTDVHHRTAHSAVAVVVAQPGSVLSLDGEGSATTSTFSTWGTGWTAAFAWNCTSTPTGSSNFIAWAQGTGGQDLLANELSPSGSGYYNVVLVGAGTFTVAITTQCSWHLDVYPVRTPNLKVPVAPTPTGTASGGATTSTAPPVVSPAGSPTAICNDGTYSYSVHRSGTCSHHGGVAAWL